MNNKQATVCKSYAKSHDRFENNKSFRLVSTNSILLKRSRAFRGFINYSLSQPRRYFNILNLFKPGELLNAAIYSKEVI